jgi:hypothetical protein
VTQDLAVLVKVIQQNIGLTFISIPPLVHGLKEQILLGNGSPNPMRLTNTRHTINPNTPNIRHVPWGLKQPVLVAGLNKTRQRHKGNCTIINQLLQVPREQMRVLGLVLTSSANINIGYKVTTFLTVSRYRFPRLGNLIIPMMTSQIPLVSLPLNLFGILDEGVDVRGTILVLLSGNHILGNRTSSLQQRVNILLGQRTPRVRQEPTFSLNSNMSRF